MESLSCQRLKDITKFDYESFIINKLSNEQVTEIDDERSRLEGCTPKFKHGTKESNEGEKLLFKHLASQSNYGAEKIS